MLIDKIIQQAKSKTVVVGSTMGIIEGVAIAMTFLQPVLSEKEFAIFSAVIAVLTPVFMVLFRQITTKPISEK